MTGSRSFGIEKTRRSETNTGPRKTDLRRSLRFSLRNNNVDNRLAVTIFDRENGTETIHDKNLFGSLMNTPYNKVTVDGEVRYERTEKITKADFHRRRAEIESRRNELYGQNGSQEILREALPEEEVTPAPKADIEKELAEITDEELDALLDVPEKEEDAPKEEGAAPKAPRMHIPKPRTL